MQMKLAKGYAMLLGNAGQDAKLRVVGEKQLDKGWVSLAVDKRDEETVWVEVEGWRKVALAMGQIHKGDPVLAIGQIRTDEYNGKSRKYLNAEWVGVANGSAPAQTPEQPSESLPELEELADDDAELPF